MIVSKHAREFIKKTLAESIQDSSQCLFLSVKNADDFIKNKNISIDTHFVKKENLQKDLIMIPFDDCDLYLDQKNWQILSQCFVDVLNSNRSQHDSLQGKLFDANLGDQTIYLKEKIVPLLETVGLKILETCFDEEKNTFQLFYRCSKNSFLKNHINILEIFIENCLSKSIEKSASTKIKLIDNNRRIFQSTENFSFH